MLRFIRRSALTLVTVATLAGGGAVAQNLGIASSNPGSIYHSTAAAIAKVASDKAGVGLTVQPFASPTIYLPAVNAGEYAFGLTNVDEARVAVEGVEQFKGRKYDKLRAVTIFFPLRSALFVRADSPIKTIADLKGKRVVDGYASQKTIPPQLDALYATAGMTRKDIKPVVVPNVVAGANAFIAGKADAFFFALGAAKVLEANASVGGIRALDVADTPQNLAAIRKHFPPAYLREEKPGPNNVGVAQPIHVMSYDGVMVASTATPEDVVYKLVSVMHDNKPALAAAFGPLGLFDPNRMAVDLGPVQWHAGAVRYLKEKGMWPPKKP